jgi:hypothetical protein
MSRTPPFDTGAFHLTVTLLPTTLVDTMSGALGNDRGCTLAEARDATLVPAALVAVMVKV